MNSKHSVHPPFYACMINTIQMLHLFHLRSCIDWLQPLDSSVNKAAKDFYMVNLGIGMQKKFAPNMEKVKPRQLI